MNILLEVLYSTLVYMLKRMLFGGIDMSKSGIVASHMITGHLDPLPYTIEV